MPRRRINLPAQEWEKALTSYSAQRAVETPAGKLVQVRTYAHGGQLYTSFGATHTRFGSSSRSSINAYTLIPCELWHGNTTRIYHDEEAILQGHRARGDHTGLIVAVKGREMVCAETIAFEADLPTVKPLDLETAKKHDRSSRGSGWRSNYKNGGRTEWLMHMGHPVVRYFDVSGETTMVLLWNNCGIIEDFYLAEDFKVIPQQESTEYCFSATVEQLELLFS